VNPPSSSPRTVRWRNAAAAALGLFGFTQMTGDLLGSRTLRGLGAISTAAPCPKVFCDLNGVEGFASEFTLLVRRTSGGEVEIPLTPELYRRLTGPYNRRNVYGAALAGAPILPRPIWEAVFCHGLRPGGPLRREFNLPTDAAQVRVRIRSKTRGRQQLWILEAPCAG
jgi:hypothetical protein